MTFEGNSIRLNHECDITVSRNDHNYSSETDTRFIDTGSECGDGVNDRITSGGEGRVTSDGQCRIIA